MRYLLALAVLLVVGLGIACTELFEPSPPPTSAVSTDPHDVAELASDRWIVWLHDDAVDVRSVADELIDQEGERVLGLWEHTIRGFSANLDPERAVALRSNQLVRSVRSDVRLRAGRAASWGLERVDQRSLPLSGGYAPILDGSGVDVYVVDGGIRSAHSAFSGRAVTTDGGFDAIRDPASMYYAEDCWYQIDESIEPQELQDWAGHGTHVAGTVGGSTFGVAPGVRRLISVRVIDCDDWFWLSDLIDGIDWITANDDPYTPAVANLSLGSGPNMVDSLWESAEAAIAASIQSTGIVYVAAAGNEGDDACDISPARMSQVITVGATDSTDTRASFSNYGTCVDLFAPGLHIVSAAAHQNPDTTCITCSTISSGTSMAAPHVSGIAAHVLQRYGSQPPSAVRDTIIAWSTSGVVVNPGTGSPNRLAFTPRVVSSEIMGPDTISDTLTYQWAAERDGGNYHSYSYEWARRYHWPDIGPGPWNVISTDSVAEPVIIDGSPHFDLRLSVTSGFHADTTQIFIFVICTEPCLEFAPEVAAGEVQRHRR